MRRDACLVPDLGSPEGIAIDHLGRNIFWTDSQRDRIEVAKLDGTQRRVLFETDLVNPRGIVTDSVRGYPCLNLGVSLSPSPPASQLQTAGWLSQGECVQAKAGDGWWLSDIHHEFPGPTLQCGLDPVFPLQIIYQETLQADSSETGHFPCGFSEDQQSSCMNPRRAQRRVVLECPVAPPLGRPHLNTLEPRLWHSLAHPGHFHLALIANPDSPSPGLCLSHTLVLSF